MNIKILAAVFTTLAAVFVIINAGDVQTGEGLSDLMPDFLEGEQKIPKPENPSTAEIKIHSQNTSMNLNGDATVRGLTKYISKEVDIESENDIEFKNFDGELFIGKKTEISGNAEGFTSNGVQVARNFKLEKKLNNSEVSFEGADRVKLDFQRADIDLQSTNSSSGIQETNTSVSIESFSGNMTVRPENMEITLEGNVSTVKAGQTTFG